MSIKSLKRNKGYGMIEMLFYVSLFAILSIAVINSMITMTKSFKETTIQAEFLNGGNVLERLSREIRGAQSITSITNSNDLKIKSFDGTDLEFVLSGQNIQFLKNGNLVGNLNSSGVSVLGLSFTKISTVKSEAVKIVLTVKSVHDTGNRTEDFYNTVVLRGEY